MEKSESKIESMVVKGVKNAGGLCLKLSSVFMSGMPDRIILLPGGKIIFAEIKSLKRQLAHIQEKRRVQLETLGFRVVVIKSQEEALIFLEEL